MTTVGYTKICNCVNENTPYSSKIVKVRTLLDTRRNIKWGKEKSGFEDIKKKLVIYDDNGIFISTFDRDYVIKWLKTNFSVNV